MNPTWAQADEGAAACECWHPRRSHAGEGAYLRRMLGLRTSCRLCHCPRFRPVVK